MFKDDYKNEIDKIKPDGYIKQKVLKNLKNGQKPKVLKFSRLGTAVAAVLCVAIVVSGIGISSQHAIKVTENESITLMKTVKSYDGIYKELEKLKPSFWENAQNRLNGFFFGFAKDSNAIDEEYEYAIGTTESTSDGGSSQETDHSETTTQVEGVDEADIVKTDGKYIYYLIDNELRIIKAEGEKSSLVSKTVLKADVDESYGDMFLKGDRLILLQPDDHINDCEFVSIFIYDISDPANPKEIAASRQEGMYNSSRMVGDYIYLISNSSININKIDKDDPTTFVPVTEINGVCEAVPADSIYRYNQEKYTNQYTVIGAFNYKDGKMSDTASLLGGTDNIYCSQGNIILANTDSNSYDDSTEGSYSQNRTTVSRLEIKQGKIEYKTTGEVEGTLKNQFFIDEHNGYFRFVTTVDMVEIKKRSFDNADDMVISYELNNTYARLTVLDGELNKVGEIKDLAKGERVYSVRFMGDIAYFVTFRQTDPLFSADLSDPHNPKILGELKIPGFSEYMYPYGDGLLLGFGMDADERTGRTTDLKLSMFDINDPSNVSEQDKTVIDGYEYSPALSDHKAMLVSCDKNLIGFAATDNYDSVKYLIYTYTGDGFDRVATLEIQDGYNYYAMTDVRGLFIGDNFYIASKNVLQVFDINTFLQLTRIDF